MSDILKPITNSLIPMAATEPQGARNGRATDEERKAKVCEGFESYFVLQMLKDLEKTAHVAKKGRTEETYMSIVNQKVADHIAKRGIGLKEMLMRYADRGSAKVPEANGDNRDK